MNFNDLKCCLMDKMIKVVVVVAFLLFILFIIFVAGISTNMKTYQSSATALNTRKIEWGIKRGKDHKQPDLGSDNLKVMSEFNGIALGNSEKKIIYLTFDVGYDGGYMQQILETLKNNQVKAAFFVTDQFIKTSSDVAKQIIDEGHILANHTVNHKSMPSLSKEEIEEEVMNLHKDVFEKLNYEMKYIRPPKGEYSEKSVAVTNSLGYKTVMWSFAYEDWDDNKQGREEYAKQKIMDNLHNGEIMLLHATSKDNNNILDEIIKKIKAEGYEFKSLDEFEN